MINLNQSQINEVYLDLANVTTVTPAYYLFQLINTSNGEEKIFYKADTSTTPAAYNLFLIEETTSEDLTDGKVMLNAGQWTYKVFQSGTTSLSLTYSTAAYNGNEYISSGLVWVEEAAQTQPVKYTPTDAVKKIYKPNNG
jgi:hypothetical protein